MLSLVIGQSSRSQEETRAEQLLRWLIMAKSIIIEKRTKSLKMALFILRLYTLCFKKTTLFIFAITLSDLGRF